jgi:hypothetical protein
MESSAATKLKLGKSERPAELRQTATRLGAFMRHVFIFSGGEHLRKM